MSLVVIFYIDNLAGKFGPHLPDEVNQPKGFGRVRLRRVADKSEQGILLFVCKSIELGSVVRTDESLAYRTLLKNGYHRDKKGILNARSY